MSLQLAFHIAIKTASLSPKSAARWRKIHIFAGYLLIAAFISHSDFSLPDTGFEWALWASFVLVALSGIFGTYLDLVTGTPSTGLTNASLMIVFQPAAPNSRRMSMRSSPTSTWVPVISPSRCRPMMPGSWISTSTRLRPFLQGQRNSTAHLLGSQRPLRRLTDEIDNLSRYVDQRCKEKLTTIKGLVVEKDRLDFARIYLGLANGWLFVHVPVTYSLIVLTVLHVVVVYAFSSGPW